MVGFQCILPLVLFAKEKKANFTCLLSTYLDTLRDKLQMLIISHLYVTGDRIQHRVKIEYIHAVLCACPMVDRLPIQDSISSIRG